MLGKYWFISTVLVSLLTVASCSLVDKAPNPPPAVQETIPAVASSTQETPPTQPRLAVVATKDVRENIFKTLLRSEPKPLTAKDVGYYMDVLYANLQQQLSGDIATMSRLENTIHIVFPGSTAFASNQVRINPSVAQTLARVAEVLTIYTKTIVEIEGHTDNQGNVAYNQQLSEQRALAVGEFLADHNVAENRLLIMGFGPTKPIAVNDTAEGQAKNRRVEIILMPVLAGN